MPSYKIILTRCQNYNDNYDKRFFPHRQVHLIYYPLQNKNIDYSCPNASPKDSFWRDWSGGCCFTVKGSGSALDLRTQAILQARSIFLNKYKLMQRNGNLGCLQLKVLLRRIFYAVFKWIKMKQLFSIKYEHGPPQAKASLHKIMRRFATINQIPFNVLIELPCIAVYLSQSLQFFVFRAGKTIRLVGALFLLLFRLNPTPTPYGIPMDSYWFLITHRSRALV